MQTCYLPDGRMLNRLLIQQGYARPLAIAPNTRHAATFEMLAGEAQAARWGL